MRLMGCAPFGSVALRSCVDACAKIFQLISVIREQSQSQNKDYKYMTFLRIPTLLVNTSLHTLFAETLRELANGTRAMKL